jgi:hypothetical protein
MIKGCFAKFYLGKNKGKADLMMYLMRLILAGNKDSLGL